MEPYEAMSGTRLCELDAKGYGSAGLELERRANAYPELVAEVERLHMEVVTAQKWERDAVREAESAQAEVERLRKQLERRTWCLGLLAQCTPPHMMQRYRERLRAEAPWHQKDGTPPT